MKKKLFFGFAAFLLIAVVTFNVQLIKKAQSYDVKLAGIELGSAQTTYYGTPVPHVTTYHTTSNGGYVNGVPVVCASDVNKVNVVCEGSSGTPCAPTCINYVHYVCKAGTTIVSEGNTQSNCN